MPGRRVAIVTGGTRGICSGIASALADDGFDLLLTYNRNREAADAFVCAIKSNHSSLHCEVVGGDISLPTTRNAVFESRDANFSHRVLGVVVHSAGQYVGLTSSNCEDLPAASSVEFGNGSILADDGISNLEYVRYYQRLYGDAFVDLCERGIARMMDEGSLIGISSPGCNLTYRAHSGYSLPGSRKCVMEYAMRIFALNVAAKLINCNLVVPGFTVTDAWSKVAEAKGMERDAMMDSFAKGRVPMKWVAGPRDVGDVVAFLCSSK